MFSISLYALLPLLLSTLVTSQTNTSTTSPSTPTVLSCPASNGQQYTTADGKVFEVLCYIDDPGTDLSLVYATTLIGCIETCDTTSGCVGFSWVSSANGVQNPCYLKSALDAKTDSGVWAARLVDNPAADTLACPASNGTTYTTSSGETFEILCYVDNSGVGLSTIYVSTLYDCVEACAGANGCESFSWVSMTNGVSNPCYLKSEFGTAEANSGVWGGRLVATS